MKGNDTRDIKTIYAVLLNPTNSPPAISLYFFMMKSIRSVNGDSFCNNTRTVETKQEKTILGITLIKDATTIAPALINGLCGFAET